MTGLTRNIGCCVIQHCLFRALELSTSVFKCLQVFMPAFQVSACQHFKCSPDKHTVFMTLELSTSISSVFECSCLHARISGVFMSAFQGFSRQTYCAYDIGTVNNTHTITGSSCRVTLELSTTNALELSTTHNMSDCQRVCNYRHDPNTQHRLFSVTPTQRLFPDSNYA